MYHVLFVICIYIPISCIAFGIKYYYYKMTLKLTLCCVEKSQNEWKPSLSLRTPPTLGPTL